MNARTDNWYLVQVRPGAAERARLNLARQAFRSFMPQRETTQRRGRHLQRARRPLFPGYLFVQIDPERQEWRRINSTYGVSRLVALERGCPTRVPPQVMAGIFGHCDGDTWRVQADGLEPGTEARLVQGPFARMIATVEALPEADRVLVLLELMGRATRVGVSLDDLEIL
ncbi:MAG: transcriptional activator RfaH [Sedimentitalea sp.]|nr:transcriptional activator RfaH [Sedimentitalea sp.]